MQYLKNILETQNKHVLLCLVRLWLSVSMAISRHPTEEDELSGKATMLENVIAAVFSCNSMDDESNVLRLLLPSTQVECGFGDALYEPEQNVPFLLDAYALRKDEVLGLSLEHSLKFIFGLPQVVNVINSLFAGSIVHASRCVCACVEWCVC